MKEYKKEVSYAQVKNLINQLYNMENVQGYQICGTLLDNYCFDLVGTNVHISRMKHRDYMFLVEHYVNEWASDYILILTDNGKYYNQFIDEYFKDED